ncbi:hypothetical protein [Priestia megaterium]|uniref:hypothetical protein n=1 Tax=Priestia megaterium TaxID=1404 RepID=UPI00203CEC4B|nr:hypothetical protein [Priestia megaterium]MCM3544110.1 hypothetical protein [Priestia megaterium]
MISLPIQHIPVPMFLLNKDNEIIEFTPSVTKNFPPVQNFLDLVDEDSQEKVKRALQGKEEVQIEVNMRTFSNPVALFDFHFEPEAYHSLHAVCCYPIHEHMMSVQSTLQQFRSMLMQDSSQVNQDFSVRETDVETARKMQLVDLQRHFREMKTNVLTIQDLLSIIRSDVIEAGKGEYIELVSTHLFDIQDVINQELECLRQKNKVH